MGVDRPARRDCANARQDFQRRVSFYHLSFHSGSRAGGACAGATHAYITRTEEYDEPERDTAVHTESDHMPSWAQDDAREYWDAADLPATTLKAGNTIRMRI
jgi:hypothetical protein